MPARGRWWLRVLAVSLELLRTTPGMAARPLDTEDTDVVAPAHAELELGIDYAQRGGARLGRSVGVVTAGLLRRLDVSLEGGGALYDPSGDDRTVGLTDSLLRLKYRLNEETETMPALLVSPAVRLPTARDGLGFDGVDVQVLVAARKALRRLQLTGNASYVFATEDHPFTGWLLSLSAEWLLGSAVTPVAEIVAGLHDRENDGSVLLRGGVVYTLTERIRLDAAIAYGAAGPVPEVAATAGLTVLLF